MKVIYRKLVGFRLGWKILPLLQALTLSFIWISPIQADDSKSFKTGVLLPLSGPIPEMGGAFKRGIELYLVDHPKTHLSFVFEDHKYDGKTAVTGLHALRARNDIDLMVVWGNTPAGAAAPVAEQQRIPTLTISMNPDARDRKYVVSLGPTVHQGAEVLVEQLKSLGAGSVGAVTIDIGNALEWIDLVDKALGGAMVKKIISSDEVDFKPIISQLRARSIDRLVLFLLPQQALTFLRQAKQLNYTPYILGGDVFAIESFQRESRKYTDKASFVYGGVPNEFIARLAKSELGTSYFFEVATGYSVAQILEGVAERLQTGAEPSDVLDALSAAQTTGLPLESIRFVKTPEFGRHFEVGMRYYK